MKKSLLYPLFLRLGILFFLIMSLLTLFTYVSLNTFLNQAVSQNLMNEAHLLTPDYMQKLTRKNQLPSPGALHFLHERGLGIAIYNAKLQVVHSQLPPPLKAYFPKTLTKPRLGPPHPHLQAHLMYVTIPIKTPHTSTKGYVVLGLSLQPTHVLLGKEFYFFLLASATALLAIFVIGIPLLGKALTPLRSMITTAETMSAQDLTQRIAVPASDDEVQRLALALNHMLSRLETAFANEKQSKERMRRFVADVSHELRTPLTSVSGFLEILEMDSTLDENKRQVALEAMQQETKRLTELISELLQLARLDEGAHLTKQEQSLWEIVIEMQPHLEILAKQRSLHVIGQGSSYMMAAHSTQIKQVLYNLVQNAVNHTDPKTGEIKIMVTAAGDYLHLNITDNGSGIDAKDIPLLFDRFYRADKSRSRKQGGFGLGLAIVQAIVLDHQGEIEVKSDKKMGTTVHILFPRIKLASCPD